MSDRDWMLQSLWRAALVWGVLIAGELFVRQLFDTFAPPAPTGYGPRSAVTTFAAVGTFILIVAVLAGFVGHILGIICTTVLYYTVIARDATKLTTFDMTGGWGEALGFSIVVPLVGALFALGGGLISRGLSHVWSLAVTTRQPPA
jgi:hypothetical protein